MTQAGAEVLPEGRSRTGIVGRKEHGQHEDEPADACWAHEDAEDESKPNGEFRVSHQESDRRGVRKHESAKHRGHERVGAALEESVDPILEAAVKSELRAENFVLAENQEEYSDGDAQHGERAGVPIGGGQLLLHKRE